MFAAKVNVGCQNIDCVVTTVALLCGALYPLSLRSYELTTQRNLLTSQLRQFGTFKQQVLLHLGYNNNNDRLTAFDPGQPG